MYINKITIPSIQKDGLHFQFYVTLKGENRSARVVAMVDSGASGVFLNRSFCEVNGVTVQPLEQAITVYNIDGTKNVDGAIREKATLTMTAGSHVETLDFFVTSLSSEDVILGLPWLQSHNPEIDWASGSLTLASSGSESATDDEREEPTHQIKANRAERRR